MKFSMIPDAKRYEDCTLSQLPNHFVVVQKSDGQVISLWERILSVANIDDDAMPPCEDEYDLFACYCRSESVPKLFKLDAAYPAKYFFSFNNIDIQGVKNISIEEIEIVH